MGASGIVDAVPDIEVDDKLYPSALIARTINSYQDLRIGFKSPLDKGDLGG